MQFRGMVLFTGILLLAAVPGQGQPASTQTPTVFKTEARLVPVDVVVQDKKGNYVHDLEMKDFKLWEDNKEQTITFPTAWAAPSPAGRSPSALSTTALSRK